MEQRSGLSCVGRKGYWKYVILAYTRSRADTRQIWTLPKLALVFSTTALSTLQNVCTDSYEGPAPSASQDRKPSDTDVESILIAPLGESYHKPHLFVSSGTFVRAPCESLSPEARLYSRYGYVQGNLRYMKSSLHQYQTTP